MIESPKEHSWKKIYWFVVRSHLKVDGVNIDQAHDKYTNHEEVMKLVPKTTLKIQTDPC